MSQLSMCVFAYAGVSRWLIPALLALVVAAFLLLIGMGIFAVCKAIGKRYCAAVMKEAQRLSDAEKARQSEATERLQASSQSEIASLLLYCEALHLALCGTSLGQEHDLQQICGKKGDPYTPPEPRECYRVLAIELAALVKVLHKCDQRLANGLLVAEAEIAVYSQWYEELDARFLQQSEQTVFSSSTMAAQQEEAQKSWRDVIRYPDMSKGFLLECLQHSQVQAQSAFASARRALVKDLRLVATGEYRASLSYWALSEALRFVLKAKYEGLDIADTQVVEANLRTFAQALRSKCIEDGQMLHQELYAFRREMATRYTVYHAVDAWAMFVPSPASWCSEDKRQQFRLVAVVCAEALDEVFALTNHQERESSWWENSEVLWHARGRLRSTSVGDVVVLPDRRAWMVMPMGWKELVPSALPAASLA